MIDPLTITAAGSAVGTLEGVLFGDESSSKISNKKKSEANFDQMFAQQQATLTSGVSADQALDLVGANVTVQGSDGKKVTGLVERIELQPDGVSLRVQGHDYLNTQVVKVNKLA